MEQTTEQDDTFELVESKTREEYQEESKPTPIKETQTGCKQTRTVEDFCRRIHELTKNPSLFNYNGYDDELLGEGYNKDTLSKLKGEAVARGYLKEQWDDSMRLASFCPKWYTHDESPKRQITRDNRKYDLRNEINALTLNAEIEDLKAAIDHWITMKESPDTTKKEKRGADMWLVKALLARGNDLGEYRDRVKNALK